MAQFSVIIPAYNQGHYLQAAIDSVLSQTVSDVEVLLIDDGSTDNTRQVAQAYTDQRVRYIYQRNRGLSAARNTGLRAARGEFISFLDSDDLFLSKKLEVLVAELERHPHAGFAAGLAILIDQNGKRLDRTVGVQSAKEPLHLLLGNPFHVGSVLVKRSWMERVEPFDEQLRACEDWEMWLLLELAGCAMYAVDQPVALYRVHPDQMTREAGRMRKAMLTVLDKLFARPDLPDHWRVQKNVAYSAALFRSAVRAYHACDLVVARQDMEESVRLNPQLLEDDGKRLAEGLLGWANAPMVEDPLAYLERVYHHLPARLDGLKQRRRRDLSQAALQLAFEHYRRGDLRLARNFMLRALRYQPSHLKNRGVLSILARSYFGFLPS